MRLSSMLVAAIAAMLWFAAPTAAQTFMCDDDSCEVEAPSYPTCDPDSTVVCRMPLGRRCEVDGVTFQCFTLDEYITIWEMDVDLAFYVEAYPAAQETIAYLEGITQHLSLAIDAAEERINILSEERDRLIDRWTEENRLRLEAENRPLLGSWIAWGLVAAEAVAIFVLSLVTGFAL